MSITTERCANRRDNLEKGVDVLIDVDTQGAAAIRNFDDAFVRRRWPMFSSCRRISKSCGVA